MHLRFLSTGELRGTGHGGNSYDVALTTLTNIILQGLLQQSYATASHLQSYLTTYISIITSLADVIAVFVLQIGDSNLTDQQSAAITKCRTTRRSYEVTSLLSSVYTSRTLILADGRNIPSLGSLKSHTCTPKPALPVNNRSYPTFTSLCSIESTYHV